MPKHERAKTVDEYYLRGALIRSVLPSGGASVDYPGSVMRRHSLSRFADRELREDGGGTSQSPDNSIADDVGSTA
ncbi:hypothetical protein LSAT2_028625 [Lamellibrachia satsuma]|nr:hypothetical protein LSAT2_028625 [Lamellibrachia satsuma]